jgi:predicted RNA-binding Zn-ribbon protein involved in translation (DUF1610 family)
MREQINHCPSCNGEVRVPEFLIGQMVQCPHCGHQFVAPPLPGQRVKHTYAADYEPAGVSRRLLRSKTSTAGAFMAVAGMISILFNAYNLTQCLRDPEGMKAQFVEAGEKLGKAFGQAVPVNPEEALQQQIALSIFGLTAAFLTFAGGVALARLYFLPLVWIGVIAGLINFQNCCCIASAPASILAIVTLLNPLVREGFSLPSDS